MSLDKEYYFDGTPFTTRFAVIVPRISGTLSAVSSLLIVYIIARSTQRLSTVYHRIMFGMSISDIIGSVAMALSTLPMPKFWPPKEYPPEVTLGFNWNTPPGMRLGNVHTCEMQGFMWLFGTFAMFAYNANLCVYYACSIALKMSDKSIRRKVEPFFHVIAIVAGLGVSIPPLITKSFNPSDWEAWCTVRNLCYGWDSDGNMLCIRGQSGAQELGVVLFVVLIGILAITVSLLMVSCRVSSTERELAKGIRDFANAFEDNEIVAEEMERMQNRYKTTKVINTQVMGYATVLALTIIFPFITVLGNMGLLFPGIGYSDSLLAEVLERLKLVFTPLQGLFNLLIFVAHKVYNYRRVHPGTKRRAIIYMLLFAPTEEPVLISRLSLVLETAVAGQELDVPGMRAHVEDENDEEEWFTFLVRRMGNFAIIGEDGFVSNSSISSNPVEIEVIRENINIASSDRMSDIESKPSKALASSDSSDKKVAGDEVIHRTLRRATANRLEITRQNSGNKEISDNISTHGNDLRKSPNSYASSKDLSGFSNVDNPSSKDLNGLSNIDNPSSKDLSGFSNVENTRSHYSSKVSGARNVSNRFTSLGDAGIRDVGSFSDISLSNKSDRLRHSDDPHEENVADAWGDDDNSKDLSGFSGSRFSKSWSRFASNFSGDSLSYPSKGDSWFGSESLSGLPKKR